MAYLLWRLNPPKFKRIKIAEFRTISQQTWTFGVAEILNFVYDRADLTLLAFLTVNNSEISYYGTALNIALPVSPFTNLTKCFSSIYHKTGKIRFPQSQKKVLYIPPLLLLVGAGVAGSLILFFFGQKLIDLLMGPAYSAAGSLLTMVSPPLLILKAVNVALSSFLIARQNQEMKLLPLAFVAILKAILIIVFYKNLGWKVWLSFS